MHGGARAILDALGSGTSCKPPHQTSVLAVLELYSSFDLSAKSFVLQVLCMVGIRPVPDALGRVNKLEVMTLEELGRPRVDVVVNCSGVFRDLFVNQMNLLDRAVKMAAELDEPDEMNFVRKHARQQVQLASVRSHAKRHDSDYVDMDCHHSSARAHRALVQTHSNDMRNCMGCPPCASSHVQVGPIAHSNLSLVQKFN